MAPDVSVIIPIYNKVKYLDACLESVLSQRDVAIEVICIDDASTDGSADIASQYAKADARLTLAAVDVRRGAARARNLGIERANGRWLQFTDADDLLPKDCLAAMCGAARATGADVVRGNLDRVQQGRISPFPAAVRFGDRSGRLLDLPELWIPWFHTCYLLSSDLLRSRGIRYPDLMAGEDPVFIARVLTSAKQIATVALATYVYRQDETRPPPTRPIVDDYLRHAEMVKAIYTDEFLPCWNAYRALIQDDLRLLADQAGLIGDDRVVVEERISSL